VSPSQVGIVAAARQLPNVDPSGVYWTIPWHGATGAANPVPAGNVASTGGTDRGAGTAVSSPLAGVNATEYTSPSVNWWEIGPASSFAGSNTGYTLSLWVRHTSTTSRLWMSEWGSVGGANLWFGGADGTAHATPGLHFSNNSIAFDDPSTTFPVGTWRLVSIVQPSYLATTREIHVDGSPTVALTCTGMTVGTGVIGFFFDAGDIYHATFYPRPLTSTELAQLYASKGAQ
jgi:hypothetical protein